MLRAPFPYFGGKRRVAREIWRRFGNPAVYVEPFCGSAALLLARPHQGKHEIINDKCGFVVNFWRAVKADPQAVARWADFPCNETELHARHVWLMKQDLDALHRRLYEDVDYFDSRKAGYWVYGQSAWIGYGWCRETKARRIRQNMPQMHDEGVFVERNKPRLTGMPGVFQGRPNLSGSGVFFSNKKPEVVTPKGVFSRHDLYGYFAILAERLQSVRVCCGDWTRICTHAVTQHLGLTAVFLDPPYRTRSRQNNIYIQDSKTVARDAWLWALEKGTSPEFRIALCGLEGDYRMPDDWTCYTWRSTGYYGGKSRGHLERIYFSPLCV